MISSTAFDLPEHRNEVKDACLRQSMFPMMMEHLPANGADAIAESMRMVNEADLYLGIFAFRYGYVPEGYDISVTEMEYNRASERGIPRLIFLMHEKHPLTVVDVERGEGAVKLEALKARLKKEQVVNFFRTPHELHAQVINSLSRYRQPNLTAFHYVSDIPTPPEPYIAHSYTLSQTKALVGRQAALNLLTDWVTTPTSDVYNARILNIVAIGGMGKSALTWKWFNDIALQEMKPLAGRMWWSFYESDAAFENFVIRALAYVTKQAKEDIQKLPSPEREAQLLAILDREPYLIVLDGLERLLIAYARMDAARLADDDLDQQTANFVAGVHGLPENATQSFTGLHRLRKTADPRTGAFLRKLATVHAARILVSTRLYPADLQTDAGSERPGCKGVFLRGLTDDDALNLWRSFGVSGSRDSLLSLFHTFDNHPLLIQALAGEVAHDRHAPGDFDQWWKNHSDFIPFSLPLVQVKSHVLAFAFRGLDETAWKVLHTLSAFRMPATYDTLAALLVDKGEFFSHENEFFSTELHPRIIFTSGEQPFSRSPFISGKQPIPRRPFSSENELIASLAELEDRGLLGWDRRANRYDLHPIVRGVTWSVLGKQDKQNIYEMLNIHFESIPMDSDWLQINRLEDLTPAIELYNTLIGLERYNDAYYLYKDRLRDALLYRLGNYRQITELLILLFPDGLDQLPPLTDPDHQAYVLNELGIGSGNDQPGRAVSLFRRALDKQRDNQRDSFVDLLNLSTKLFSSGALHASEVAVRHALLIAQQLGNQPFEAMALQRLGRILAARGRELQSAKALNRALALVHLHEKEYLNYSDLSSQEHHMLRIYDYLAQCALWLGHYSDGQKLATHAMNFSQQNRYESGMIHAACLQGKAALGLGDLSVAEERLHQALTHAREVNNVEDELQALIGLAEVRRQERDLSAARELLEDVWEPAERGPFPIFHADAYNVLAQIERDAGNHAAAVKAAIAAYRLAWCDGPPFAYHWGLQTAQAHLSALGEREPSLPSFDASKYEPMPHVKIESPGSSAEQNPDNLYQ